MRQNININKFIQLSRSVSFERCRKREGSNDTRISTRTKLCCEQFIHSWDTWFDNSKKLVE